MTEESNQPDWSTRLALTIAGEVRRHRQAQGLSAQQLSERCAAWGMPIQRSVLANLESGRRTTVTVAEVLVLSAALGVPPATLLFPAGHVQSVEVLPNGWQQPVAAVDWISGHTLFTNAAAEEYVNSPLAMCRKHDQLAADIVAAIASRDKAREEFSTVMDLEDDSVKLAALNEELGAIKEQLDELRRVKISDSNSLDTSVLVALSKRQKEVLDKASVLRVGASRYVYARRRLDETEARVPDAEERLKSFRADMRNEQLIPPLLTKQLHYIDPSSTTYEDELLQNPLEIRGQVPFPPRMVAEFREPVASVREGDAFNVDTSEAARELGSSIPMLADRLADEVIARLESRGIIKPQD